MRPIPRPILTSAQAARFLGVSKKTLHRWEESGKIKSRRHPTNGYRYFNAAAIQDFSAWLQLRREEWEHVRKLEEINRRMDKFVNTVPLDGREPPLKSARESKEMIAVFKEKEQWEEEYRKIRAGYKLLDTARR